MKKIHTILGTIALAACSLTSNAQIPANGLQLYYPFDSTLTDYSGYNRTATSSQTSYYYIGPNNNDYGITNNNSTASTQYNYTNDSTAFRTQDYSVLCWMKIDGLSNGSYANILENGRDTTNSMYFRIRKNTSGSTSYLENGFYNIGTNSGFHEYISFSGNIYGAWHMIGATSTYNASTQERTTTLYLDGAEIAKNTTTSNTYMDYSSYKKMNIASREGSTTMYLNGVLEDLAYYNRALDSTEVVQYYNACAYANVVTKNNLSLQASTKPGLSYQWINCATKTAIAGATNTNFTPTTNGSYAVVLSYTDGTNTCTDTSACNTITISGTSIKNSLNNQQTLSVYPNPAKNTLIINTAANIEIRISNTVGSIVYKANVTAGENTIDISALSGGVYIIQTTNGITTRFIKE